MANILVVYTTNAGSIASDLTTLGHDYTLTSTTPNATELDSLWSGDTFDAIIYFGGATTGVTSWVRTKWQASVPVILGCPWDSATTKPGQTLQVTSTEFTFSYSAFSVNVTGTHPVVDGFSGSVAVSTVASGSTFFSWMMTDVRGDVLAHRTESSSHHTIVAVDSGVTLVDSSTSAARLVYLGWLNRFALSTTDGVTILGQAVDWLSATEGEGSGSGEFGWTGTGAGFEASEGAGSGSFGWAGSGSGVGDGHQGSGSGTFGWAGTGEGLVPPLPFDSVNLPAPIPAGVAVDLLPVPAAIPAGVSEWPVVIQSHPMPALSSSLTRVVEGVDYTMTEADYGRLHVWVDGVDVTYLRDVPAEILTWSSSSPNGDTAVRLSFPQIAPWEQDDLGLVGDLIPFRQDAPVEIGILRADDSIGLLWEGYLSSVGDSTGENRESTTFGCHGTLWQAAHTMHIPPLYLEPTDVGILVARSLNSVPSRRYPALPEVETGILSRERGSQTQSVLAYVQDLLSTAWTDDLRQWTLAKVAPYTYRTVLKDLTTVHATFTKGAPGVEVDLERDESTRVDAVYARGVAPSGGVWANWFWPGLDLYVPPPYLYASAGTNMTVGATDAGTLTGSGVSDWQRRVLELGYTGITVDGVFNNADSQAARWVQRLRGILVDGIVGPQTWNATWDVGAQALDLTAIRLPLAWKPEVERHLYTANGAVASDNPDYDSGIVRHAHDLNFGADVSKTTARPLAQRYLDIFGEASWTGRVTVTTDPHEGTSRLEIREGMNLDIVGHGMVQVVDVEHTPTQSTFLVDERARDAMTVDALLARDRDARRDPVARPGNPSKLAQLDRNQIVQYEDESQAGWVPRLAINGSAGLYTVVPIFVSQTGSVASLEFRSSGPATAFSISIFGRPVTANQCKAWCTNPITSSDGWYDNEEELRTRFGYIDTWGTPGNLGGYYPRQEGEGPLTGKMRDDAGFPFVSEVGGYLWVAIFAAGDCFVEGRLYPGVPL